MIITKIERQKKNSIRRSIFLDGSFAFGVSEDIFVRFSLYEGREIDEKEKNEIENAELEHSVKSLALKFRSYRPRSKKEIVEYLHKKDFDETLISKAIEYLESMKLLDDEEFARMMCRDKLHLKPVGKQVMKQMLFKKGISSPIIQKTLSEFYSPEFENELAMKEASKRMKRIASLPSLTIKRRLYEHLMRRGYDSSTCRTIVNQLVK